MTKTLKLTTAQRATLKILLDNENTYMAFIPEAHWAVIRNFPGCGNTVEVKVNHLVAASLVKHGLVAQAIEGTNNYRQTSAGVDIYHGQLRIDAAEAEAAATAQGQAEVAELQEAVDEYTRIDGDVRKRAAWNAYQEADRAYFAEKENYNRLSNSEMYRLYGVSEAARTAWLDVCREVDAMIIQPRDETAQEPAEKAPAAPKRTIRQTVSDMDVNTPTVDGVKLTPVQTATLLNLVGEDAGRTNYIHRNYKGTYALYRHNVDGVSRSSQPVKAATMERLMDARLIQQQTGKIWKLTRKGKTVAGVELELEDRADAISGLENDIRNAQRTAAQAQEARMPQTGLRQSCRTSSTHSATPHSQTPRKLPSSHSKPRHPIGLGTLSPRPISCALRPLQYIDKST
jgi:hypothetical protein